MLTGEVGHRLLLRRGELKSGRDELPAWLSKPGSSVLCANQSALCCLDAVRHLNLEANQGALCCPDSHSAACCCCNRTANQPFGVVLAASQTSQQCDSLDRKASLLSKASNSQASVRYQASTAQERRQIRSRAGQLSLPGTTARRRPPARRVCSVRQGTRAKAARLLQVPTTRKMMEDRDNANANASADDHVDDDDDECNDDEEIRATARGDGWYRRLMFALDRAEPCRAPPGTYCPAGSPAGVQPTPCSPGHYCLGGFNDQVGPCRRGLSFGVLRNLGLDFEVLVVQSWRRLSHTCGFLVLDVGM
eukprot:2295472-Rhodomonas_salina.6